MTTTETMNGTEAAQDTGTCRCGSTLTPTRPISPGAGPPGPRGDQGTGQGHVRPAAARARPAPRLPAQRVRLLRRHAHEGRPGGRRDRAAAVRAGGVARHPVLHRTRAGGARLHRGGHPDDRRPRPRRGLQTVAAHFSPEKPPPCSPSSSPSTPGTRSASPPMRGSPEATSRDLAHPGHDPATSLIRRTRRSRRSRRPAAHRRHGVDPPGAASVRPLQFAADGWSELMRLEPGSLVPLQRHTGDVHAYNLSGIRRSSLPVRPSARVTTFTNPPATPTPGRRSATSLAWYTSRSPGRSSTSTNRAVTGPADRPPSTPTTSPVPETGSYLAPSLA